MFAGRTTACGSGVLQLTGATAQGQRRVRKDPGVHKVDLNGTKLFAVNVDSDQDTVSFSSVSSAQLNSMLRAADSEESIQLLAVAVEDLGEAGDSETLGEILFSHLQHGRQQPAEIGSTLRAVSDPFGRLSVPYQAADVQVCRVSGARDQHRLAAWDDVTQDLGEAVGRTRFVPATHMQAVARGRVAATETRSIEEARNSMLPPSSWVAVVTGEGGVPPTLLAGRTRAADFKTSFDAAENRNLRRALNYGDNVREARREAVAYGRQAHAQWKADKASQAAVRLMSRVIKGDVGVSPEQFVPEVAELSERLASLDTVELADGQELLEKAEAVGEDARDVWDSGGREMVRAVRGKDPVSDAINVALGVGTPEGRKMMGETAKTMRSSAVGIGQKAKEAVASLHKRHVVSRRQGLMKRAQKVVARQGGSVVSVDELDVPEKQSSSRAAAIVDFTGRNPTMNSLNTRPDFPDLARHTELAGYAVQHSVAVAPQVRNVVTQLQSVVDEWGMRGGPDEYGAVVALVNDESDFERVVAFRDARFPGAAVLAPLFSSQLQDEHWVQVES